MGRFAGAACTDLLQKGYDLGPIPEDGGTVSRVYTFRNSGNAPGSWSSGPRRRVPARKPTFRKTGHARPRRGRLPSPTIPRRQHGAFNKAISIYTNVPGARYIVTLRGEVTVR